MKKIFLLLSTGFFLSTFSVIGQEQQKENKEPKKIKVSESEKQNLKSKNKVQVESSKSVQLVNRKEAKPKYVRREAESVREEKIEK